MSLLYTLPTTGAVQWQSFLQDTSSNGQASPALALTANARGRLRAALKKNKRRSEEQHDWSEICSVVEEYLPLLGGVLTCLDNDSLLLKHEPVFSWRASLSASTLKAPPRVVLPSLQYELTYVLLTLALAHANAATTKILHLGDYERQRHTSETQRKELDDLVNSAADRLSQAAGILSYVSEKTIPAWETAVLSTITKNRPAETTRDMTSALSKICLADAERLAIRRLMTRAVSDSTLTPGHPLPKSHPSPSLLAKLHINVAQLYEGASGLMSSHPGSLPPSDAVRKYAADQSAVARALAHKWLGVDKGERDGQGEAVAWLTLAKEELGPLLKRNRSFAGELASINSFLAAYSRLNDTVAFQPVPKQAALHSLTPGGRAALAIKAFSMPPPRFDGGANSRVSLAAAMADLAVKEHFDESDSEAEMPARGTRSAYY